MIQAVLFDFDGTLLDTRNFTYQTFANVFGSLGIKPVSKRKFALSVGLSLEESYRSLIAVREVALTVLVDRHRQFQRDNLHLIKPFPKSKKTLMALKRQGIKMAVVTSRIYNVTAILIRCGLLSYFSVIISGADVKKYKPDPEAIYLALSEMGIAPEHSLIVGDMDVDILAGKKSGVKTFAVTCGFSSKKILMRHQPDFIGNDVEDILKLVYI